MDWCWILFYLLLFVHEVRILIYKVLKKKKIWPNSCNPCVHHRKGRVQNKFIVYWVANLPNDRERWRLYSWRKWDCWNSTTNEKIQSHVHSTLVSNEATGTHKLNLSDDFSLKNWTLDMVNDVGLIREVSFMQSVLSQQEQKKSNSIFPCLMQWWKQEGKLICARHILKMLPCLH